MKKYLAVLLLCAGAAFGQVSNIGPISIAGGTAINNSSNVAQTNRANNFTGGAQTFSAGVKISPFNTLLSYGCAHDGTDASTCLNAAFAANANSFLWVEPGYTYSHASTLIVPTGTKIIGPQAIDASAGVAEFLYTGTGTAWKVADPTNTYTYGVRISGIRIASSAFGAVCLDLDHVQEGEFDHNTIGGGSGAGCAIGVNAHGMSLSHFHHNRVTWNTAEMVIDGNAVVGAVPANPSAYNEIDFNNFFEGTIGIQIKNLWGTTIHDNYFEAVDNYFHFNTAGGSYFANLIQLINVRITHNGSAAGGDVAHTNPKVFHVTGAGTTSLSSNGIYVDQNFFSVGNIAGNTAFLVDSTTSGTVGLDLWMNKNRVEGADTIFSSSKTGSAVHDYDNSYVGHDGLSAPTTLYSGITFITERDSAAFEIRAATNGLSLYGGYGAPARFAIGGLYIGSLGTAPNLGSILWGDGTGYKLNFGYWNGSAFVPTISFVDSGAIVAAGSIIGSTISPPQTGVNYVKMSGNFLQWFGGGTGGTQLGTLGNSNSDIPLVLANGAKFRVLSGNFEIGQGVTSSGGFKHQRFGTLVATPATLNATSQTLLTWATAFADANYTVTCTPDGAITGTPVFQGVVTKLPASVTVQITNLTAVASNFGGIDCHATHD